ncbi:MAG: Flp family type IVb pilin [Desulfuromonas sp.]|nr:Flp family type IVb pilin [Desulfuromonas sp.]
MKKIKGVMHTFLKAEGGATMVEYAIMLTLFVIVVIVVVRSLEDTVKEKFIESSSVIGSD